MSKHSLWSKSFEEINIIIFYIPRSQECWKLIRARLASSSGDIKNEGVQKILYSSYKGVLYNFTELI